MKAVNLLPLALGGLLLFTMLWRKFKKNEQNGIVRSWPVVGMLPSLLFNFHRFHDWVTEALSQSRGTTGFSAPGFKIVVTSDPSNIEYVVKTKFHDFVKGDQYRETVLEFIGESIILTNGQRFHSLSRIFRLALPSASFRKVGEATSWQLVHSHLLPVLDNFSQQSAAHVDLMKVLSDFTFHTFAKAGLGVDPADVAKSESFVESFDTACDLSVFRMAMPTIVWKTIRALRVGTEGRLKVAREEAHGWLDRAMKCRVDVKYEVSDFREGRPMDLLSAMTVQSPDLQEWQHLKDTALSLILAGKDTVTSGLSWFFWAICRHPHVQQKVYEEVSAVAKRKPSVESHETTQFSNQELKEMQYLQAALSESLRLYPPIPINIMEAAGDDVLPDGTFIKKGTTLIYSVYAHGRNKELWGADAGEFRPERWMSDGKFYTNSEFKFMAFNAGPRRCLGRDFAYWIMKCVAASVILRFKMRLASDRPVVTKLSFSLAMKDGLPITLEKRF